MQIGVIMLSVHEQIEDFVRISAVRVQAQAMGGSSKQKRVGSYIWYLHFRQPSLPCPSETVQPRETREPLDPQKLELTQFGSSRNPTTLVLIEQWLLGHSALKIALL